MPKKKRRGKAKAQRKATPAAAAELKIDNSAAAAAAAKSEQEVAKLNQAAKPAAQDPYDEDVFLEEARKLAIAEEKARWINGCDHDSPSLTRIHDFTRAFTSAFIGEARRTSILESAIQAAHGATARQLPM